MGVIKCYYSLVGVAIPMIKALHVYTMQSVQET